MNPIRSSPATATRASRSDWRGARSAALRLVALAGLLASLMFGLLGEPELAAAAGKATPTPAATATSTATPAPTATTGVARSARWSQPVEVSGAIGGWFPTVAADDAGDVSIVWQTNSPGQSQHDVSALYLTRWDGTKWSKPNDIALISPAGAALRSSLVADVAGRLHLVYRGSGSLQPDSVGQEKLWYTSAPVGAGISARSWAPATQITRGSQGYYSDIAVDSKGVMHAIWTESANGVWGIYYSHSKDGGANWSPRVALEDVSPVWWYRAHLVVDSHDGLHVAWETIASPSGADANSGLTTQAAAYAQSKDGGQNWTKSYFREQLPYYLKLTTLEHGPQQPGIGVDGSGKTLLVYRNASSNLVLYSVSADGMTWSIPKPLPGVQVGVNRPYDVYDMVTDSAGHVHLAMVGYPANSDTMSLLRLEWSGQSWSKPEVIVSAPEYPEYPKLAISNGNQLHIVWFTGDKPSQDRTPTGIWYSTATVSAPAMASKAVPPPVSARTTSAAPAIPTPGIQTVSLAAPQPQTVSAEAPSPSPGLLDRLAARPDYPLILTIVALIPVLAIFVGAQIGLARVWRPRHSRYR
jgi:hypothetical protein